MFDVTCMDKYGNTVTNLTQWDLNQALYIEDHGFTTPPQFHFCNKNSEKALVVQSTIENSILQVEVPNILLTEPYTITAYVYLTEDESSKTVEYVQIPVRQRPQPDSFEYEDNVVIVDIKELSAEMKALNESMSFSEEERAKAEKVRIENENARSENEEERKSSEISRQSEENIRIQSETIRVQNEELRELAEEQRKANEEIRNTAETERFSSESIREENENIRISNEEERKSSEIDRTGAEASRIESEGLRDDAEIVRSKSEEDRVAAENERENAESIRQSQEEIRQSNITSAISNIESATDRANLAAEACEKIVSGSGFVPIDEKGLAGGVATLNEFGKIPLEQLPNDIGSDADTLGGYSASHFAELGDDGKVLSSQLPSYVDDVVEGYYYNSKFYKDSTYNTEIIGETGKIYVDISNNKTYRWTGSLFCIISETITLGETSSTAYRGDRGKIAYDHSQNNLVHLTDDEKISVGYLNTVTSNVQTQLDSKLSATGTAVNASRLSNTSAIGSAIQPVYFSASGVPVATTYTLGKSVPSDAKFTDTTYSNMTAATVSAAGKAGLVPAPAAGKQACFLRGDGTWATVNLSGYLALTGGTLTGELKGTSATFSGNVTAAKVYNAVWNDYAEWFEKEDINEEFEVGDIIAWGENGVIKTTKSHDNMVVGVYSDSYGHIVGGEQLDDMEDNKKKFVPVGLCGRLFVKVVGKADKGDIIVSSDIPGVGIAIKPNEKGYSPSVGKVLKAKNSDGIELVKIIITLN